VYRLAQRNYSISFRCEFWIGGNVPFDAKCVRQIKLAVHVGVQELDRII
jgi:hypothetical protein